MNGISSKELSDGSSLLFTPYDQDALEKAATKEMKDQVETPDPNTSKQPEVDRTGPIRRYNDIFTDLGSTLMEALAIDGYEISNAIKTRRDELFRNKFPLLIPKFAVKCEECGREYSSKVQECEDCGSEELREPDNGEKQEALNLFQSVNKEGQSLQALMEMAEEDHSRVGVATIIAKYDYKISSGETTVLGRPIMDAGEVISKEIDELVKADPKRLVPVTDDNGRIGGWKWTCPVHREASLQDSPGHCDQCKCELKEVHYVEKRFVRTRSSHHKYYFEDEVIDWAYFFPRQNGLDGLSPIHHIWVKQAILYWMDVFAAAYYDPNSDSFPNKFMVVHTTDEEAWKQNFRDTETDKPENLYANQIFVNEYSDQSRSTPEVQTIDLMDDELRGQNEQIKKSYKSDIRSHFGVSDIFDSELEDAGGLNNEGLQLEVTDRHIASSHQSLTDGPLRKLSNIVGLDDWRIGFVPPEDEDLDELEQVVSIGEDAAGAGLNAEYKDGDVVIEDGEFEADDSGGGGGLFGDFDPEQSPFDEKTTRSILEKYPDADWKAIADEIDEVQHAMSEPDIDTKASVFSGRGRTPKMVTNLAGDAIEGGAVYEDMDSIDDVDEFEETMKEHLTDDEGWSESELTDTISEKFDVSEDKASTLARDQSQNVLNQAKQLAHIKGGNLDERRFYFTGPDRNKCEACRKLVEETDPHEGGTPIRHSEMMDRIEELNREHYDHDNVGYKMHINCQDTVVEAT